MYIIYYAYKLYLASNAIIIVAKKHDDAKLFDSTQGPLEVRALRIRESIYVHRNVDVTDTRRKRNTS